MPPKPKLHKSTGKATVGSSKSTTSTAVPSTSNPIELSPELQQQFEVELCWCIQQLQNSINSGKLNPKQVQESTKIMNILMGNSAPLVKKRQVMRTSFGDYRAKMEEENKKLSKALTNAKIGPVSPSKKSVFVKKSIFSTSSDNNSFKFNFKPCKEIGLSESMAAVQILGEDSKEQNEFHFVSSNNSFKFNFNATES